MGVRSSGVSRESDYERGREYRMGFVVEVV
jgi:hypothetical protein